MKIGDKVICKNNKRYVIKDDNKFEIGNSYIITNVVEDVIYVNNYAFSKLYLRNGYNFDDYFTSLLDYRMKKINKIKERIYECK